MKNMIMSISVLVVTGLFAICAMAETNAIEDGKKVSMNYTLTVNGEIVDSSKDAAPLEYVQGQGMIIPGLEKQLVGLKAGDQKTVTVAPEEAYGLVDPNALVDLPKANLPPDQDPQAGMVLQMMTQDGNPVVGIVSQVKEDSVVVDFNHPLAGQTLNFDIDIISVE